MTGRELVCSLMQNVSNLDNAVLDADGNEVVALSETVWSPEEDAIAGVKLRGSVTLLARRRDYGGS